MWNAIFGSSSEPAGGVLAHEVTFTLNGQTHTVDRAMPLNSYIRDVAKLPGTKYMCFEGGCGACIVAATMTHPVTKKAETFSVNSCLVPVLACHGWAITTVEGLGDQRKGYHPVQAQLAHFNGTQCGFCSPGMVMSMYSLLEKKAPTMAEVENNFGGNICRCTGYRPILDAFKAMSKDATPEMKKACGDIEDLYKICNKTGEPCPGDCPKITECWETLEKPKSLRIGLDATNTWFKVSSMDELFATIDTIGDVPYKLVAGNTADGVYRSTTAFQAFIDVKDVVELRTNTTSPSFTVGGNVTLTEAIELFSSTSQPGYAYLKQFAQHLEAVANTSVRNIGTIAGNLVLKKEHPGFPSDIFTMLDTVGATLNIMESGARMTKVSLTDFLSLDLSRKVILNITMPSLDANYHVRTFRISPRAQNAHAYVNAGFLVKVQDTTGWKVTEQPRIVFGGINPAFGHATELESFLNGKGLLDSSTISEAFTMLDSELQPDHVLPDASPEYRKELAQALFYKFLLSLAPDRVSPPNRSGADTLVRAISSGQQDYDTDESLWPLGQPVPKIEAVVQCSGEAQFINDIPSVPGEVYGSFLLTKVAQGTITNIDPSPALAMSGVLAFYSHTDIPGSNNYTPPSFGFVEVEEIFCSGEVKYAGQVIGLVVAETRQIASQAAGRVVVEYSNLRRPIIDMKEVLKSTGERMKTMEIKKKKVNGTKEEASAEKKDTSKVKAPAFTINGTFDIKKQYHYSMETQICLCVPKEDGMDVYSSTQWMDYVQFVISKTLQIPVNSINMNVRRLGGAYGAKITRPSHIAAATALACHKLGRAVRVVTPFGANMEIAGKRFGLRNEYEVSVDENGKIENLKATLYQDSGFCFNDSPLMATVFIFNNCYISDNFVVDGKEVRTDTASNTWCRAPGSTEAIGFIEEVMEHIAKVVNKDPLEVRLANMQTTGSPIPEMINDLKQKADYDARKQAVEDFNRNNRWKKRGMASVTMKYLFPFSGNYSSTVSIYHGDGTVAVSHGGIEMGQGLNTKVAQVCAHILGISLENVSIKPSNSFTAPNSIVTGGSVGSEACSYATMKACQILNDRLEPIKAGMDNPTWEELIEEAHMQQVDLCASYMFTRKDDVKDYDICGVTFAEVEVDILTGEKQVIRVDLMEDAGQSMSPQVDIGQMEGAFVMGMGYWLTEELIYDPDTGRLVNNRAWNYKTPGAKDIPVDFRVHFRKNAPNPTGVLGSKATGEPPLCMSIVVLFAVRNALDSARKDAGEPDEYFPIMTPATAENIFLMSKTKSGQFQL